MVLIFKSKKALQQLLKEECVYTFRVKGRKRIGKDWVTDRRGGRKIADVVIKDEKYVGVSKLAQYVSESGFQTLAEWLDEIVKINGFLPPKGWLYKVSLLNAGGEHAPAR